MAAYSNDVGIDVSQAASQALILPGPWSVVAPNPGLASDFVFEGESGSRRDGGSGVTGIRAGGNGSAGSFGYACCPVRLEPGKWYRLLVRFAARNLDRPEHQVIHGIFGAGFSAGVQALRWDHGIFSGEEVFQAPARSQDAQLRLYFRYSSHGAVNWHEVRVEECQRVEPRVVTVVCRQGGFPHGAPLDVWGEWLDLAGSLNPDVVLLPEAFDGSTPATPVDPGGPAASLLAAKAAQWSMYTCGAFYERRDGVVYNTAPLYDRAGDLLGAYDKNLPYEPELDAGVVPGTGYGVWDTDFGRVGILICHDIWFPGAAAGLAARGAELVLLPSYGYWLEMMPARAADNGFCIAASSLAFPAGVWDSSGTMAGETASDLSRFAPSAILNCRLDPAAGLLLAQVDLNRKYSPHWKGGPMLGGPAARPHRQTRVRPITIND